MKQKYRGIKSGDLAEHLTLSTLLSYLFLSENVNKVKFKQNLFTGYLTWILERPINM